MQSCSPFYWRAGWLGGLILTAAAGQLSAQDATVDWLMKQSTSAPASQPATLPVAAPGSQTPLISKQADEPIRKGTITLSDGSIHTGPIRSTAEKPIRFYDEGTKEYRDVPIELLASMDANVVWERDEKEWHFIASGSDVKEFSGKTYPARELTYTVKLLDGQSFTGGVVAPLYIDEKPGETTQYVLNKRTKGPVGQTLAQLGYVAKVTWPAQAPTTAPASDPEQR